MKAVEQSVNLVCRLLAVAPHRSRLRRLSWNYDGQTSAAQQVQVHICLSSINGQALIH